MPETIQWLPILTELGEDVVARIIENSPDIQSAILQARTEFTTGEREADALHKLGHEEGQP